MKSITTKSIYVTQYKKLPLNTPPLYFPNEQCSCEGLSGLESCRCLPFWLTVRDESDKRCPKGEIKIRIMHHLVGNIHKFKKIK